MSSAVFQYHWQTDPSTQFRAALAQNAKIDLDLLLPGTLQGVSGDTRGALKSLTIVSIENLAWELWLWRSATRKTLTAGVVSAGSNVIGRWSFAAADGIQDISGDFIYYIDGLDVPIVDDDKSGKLHLSLVNRSVATKTANDGGAVQVLGRIAQPVY